MKDMIIKTKPELQDKKVHVMSKGKVLHTGIVLGEDKVFVDTFYIGVLETTIKGVSLQPGKKYISIFRCSEKKLKLA